MSWKRISLWGAYVLGFGAMFVQTTMVQRDLDELRDDVCFAISVDLQVMAGIVRDENPENAQIIDDLVDDVFAECNN